MRKENEEKEQNIENNKYRMFINCILLFGVLYVYLVYDVMDYTGVIIGLLLILVCAVIIDNVVRVFFRLLSKQ